MLQLNLKVGNAILQINYEWRFKKILSIQIVSKIENDIADFWTLTRQTWYCCVVCRFFDGQNEQRRPKREGKQYGSFISNGQFIDCGIIWWRFTSTRLKGQ